MPRSALMSTRNGPALDAVQLREAFDRTFAVAPQEGAEKAFDDYLAVRLGQVLHAIALTEVRAVQRLRAVTPLPSHVHAFMGLMGHAGGMLPVYDLRAWLGLPMAQPPSWIVVAARRPVGLAFDAFEGQRRLQREDLAADHSAGSPWRHIRGLLHGQAAPCPVIWLDSVVRAVEAASASNHNGVQKDPGKKEH